MPRGFLRAKPQTRNKQNGEARFRVSDKDKPASVLNLVDEDRREVEARKAEEAVRESAASRPGKGRNRERRRGAKEKRKREKEKRRGGVVCVFRAKHPAQTDAEVEDQS